MSTIAIKAFFEAAANDRELAQGLAAAVGDKDGAEACVAVADYATARGYVLSAADADAGRLAVLAALEKEGVLSDEQLDNVAGGQGFINSGNVGSVASGVATGFVILPVTLTGLAVGVVNADAGMKIIASVADPVQKFFSKW